jgi:hypothetical protein
MHGRLFTLVSEDDDDGIFAWGMEITRPGASPVLPTGGSAPDTGRAGTHFMT